MMLRPRVSRATWPLFVRWLKSTDWPILAGPWRSELGFEALYWIPFLHALGIDRTRIIPITRGGAAALYGCPQGFELYEMREPKAVRVENILQQQQTGLLKQTHVTAFDKQVLLDAATTLGLTRYHVLHPSWMYQTLAPFWEGKKGLDWIWPRIMPKVDGKFTLQPLTAPALPDGVTLPKAFVAARFYARSTFPYGEPACTVARETLRQLAQQSPVVVLNSGIHADEHIDFPTKGIENLIMLSDLAPVTPANNLALQAAVIAHAQGFVGTYGGLAQLALRLGKPTVSFYTEWLGTALAHKYLADALATHMRLACVVARVNEIPMIRSVLPPLTMAGSSGGQA